MKRARAAEITYLFVGKMQMGRSKLNVASNANPRAYNAKPVQKFSNHWHSASIPPDTARKAYNTNPQEEVMTKTSMFKLGAATLFVLFLAFGSADLKTKVVLCVAIFVIYQAVSRFNAQHEVQESARQGMVNLIAENGFKPDYQHFFSDGNQVSGVAISKDDPRIILASAAVPAKLFHRKDVLSVASETGKEKDVQFKALSITGAGDKQVTKAVYVVDVSVKDLDSPRYKLYFENADLMRQWESRLTAWLDMHASK